MRKTIDTGGLPVYEHPGQGQGWWGHITGTDNADTVKGSLTEGDGWITGLNGNDVIYGTDRNERLYHETGDALLVAGGGNDQIWAGAGNDILDGGPGYDLLCGDGEASYRWYRYDDRGKDTYLFGRGSGHDSVVDSDRTVSSNDVVRFADDVRPEDVTLLREIDDLELAIIGTSDRLTLQDWFWDYSGGRASRTAAQPAL